MAPPPATEDYYLILELEQDATLEAIRKSFKRLSLIVHPDKNISADTTEAFQKLGQARDTLEDVDSRSEYDAIYHTVRRPRPPPPPPPPTSKPQARAKTPETQAPDSSDSRPEPLSEEDQIAALRKSIRERSYRWQAKNENFTSQSEQVQALKQQIKDLEAIAAAEKEEQLRRDRENQERRIQKDMKERHLISKEAELQKFAEDLEDAKKLVAAADAEENRKTQFLYASMRAKQAEKKRANETKARQEWERERLAREQWAELQRKEREQLAEIRRLQREERMREDLAAEQRRQEADTQERRRAEAKRQANQRKGVARRQRLAEEKMRQEAAEAAQRDQQMRQEAAEEQQREQQRQHAADICCHEGWWSQVQYSGLSLCPQCGVAMPQAKLGRHHETGEGEDEGQHRDHNDLNPQTPFSHFSHDKWW